MLNSDNLGGILSIESFGVDQITSFPLLNRETNTYLSALGTGGDPSFVFEPIYGTSIYTEEEKEVNDDVYVEGILQMAATPAVVEALLPMGLKLARLLLIITTNNGSKFLVGRVDLPVRVKHKNTSGTLPGTFAGGTYVFTANMLDSAPKYPF